MGWRRLSDYVRGLWLAHGFKIGWTRRFHWTGYRKAEPMKFKRPVDDEFHISAKYGDWSKHWNWHRSASGLWVRGQIEGKGQHKGIDFAVPESTLVYAMADGLSVVAGWENASNPKQGFGQRVRQLIDMPDGSKATLVYGHLSYIYAQAGHQIVKGDRIGLSGNTGHTSGPHLHVELVDPKGQYHPIEFDEDPPKAA